MTYLLQKRLLQGIVCKKSARMAKQVTLIVKNIIVLRSP